MTPSRWRRFVVPLVAAVVVGVPGIGFADPGSADPGKPETTESEPYSYIEPEIRRKMLAQVPLSKAAGVLRWEYERHRHAGYTNVMLEDGGVALYWKGGAVPAAMDTALRKAREIAPVRIVAARHSMAELRAEAQRLSDFMKRRPGGPIHTVEVRGDGSGLEAQTRDPDTVGVRAKLPRVAVPLSVVRKQPQHKTTRLDDTAPYWGGARIKNFNRGNSCTSGFAVWQSGREYLLTAAHCFTPIDGVVTPTGRWIGNAEQERWDHDVILVRADAAGRIYDGGVGSGEFSKAVSGWNWVNPYEWVCHSGSVTGALCGIQVSSSFTYSYCDYDSDGDWTCQYDLLIAWQKNGYLVVRDGDSGGPVFSLDGTTKVVAKGIISGKTWEDHGLIFQDFGTAWRDFGIVPQVG